MSDLDSENDAPAVVPLVRSKSRSSNSSISRDSVCENIDEAVPAHGWTDDEQESLIRKLLTELAVEEPVAFHKRLNRVDWKLYSITSRQPEECKQKVIQIISKMRKFRTLGELLTESLTDIRKRKRKRSSMADRNGDRNKVTTPTLRKRLRQNSPSEPFKQAEPIQTAEKEEVVSCVIPRRKRYANVKRPYAASPLRPQTPYEIFIKERLFDSSLKMCRAKKLQLYLSAYSALPDTERLKYIDKALDDEQRYQKDIEQFVLDRPDLPFERKDLRLTLSERNILFHRSISHRFHPEGYPGVDSGYKLFLMEETTKHSITDRSKQWVSSVGEKWKRLSMEEKKEYSLRVRTMWKQYENAAQIFLDHCSEELRDAMCSKVHRTPRMVAGKMSVKGTSSFIGLTPVRDFALESSHDDTFSIANRQDVARTRKNRERRFSGRDYFVSQNELEYLAQCPFSTIDNARKKLRRVYKTLPPARQKLYDAMAGKFGNIF